MTINDAPVLPGTPAGEPDPELARWEALEHSAAQVMENQPRMLVSLWLREGAIAVLAGMTLHRYVPHPLAAVIPVVLLIAVPGSMTSVQAWLRARARPEPGWLAEYTAYREWLPRRMPAIPAATLAAADRYLGGLAPGQWKSAHLIIARYDGPPSSIGATSQLGDRIQVILGSHVAEGPPEVAIATFAHECRHAGWLRAVLFDLGIALRLPSLVILLAWALPWQGAIIGAAALRVAAMLIIWGVEVSCDLGALADAGPSAMSALFDVMTATLRTRKATRPAAQWAAASIRMWVSGPPHPPVAVRRAIVRAVCWRGGRRVQDG